MNRIGALLILIGSIININTLTIGFIGAGIINILMAITHNAGTPLIKFIIFLLIVSVLILNIVFKK